MSNAHFSTVTEDSSMTISNTNLEDKGISRSLKPKNNWCKKVINDFLIFLLKYINYNDVKFTIHKHHLIIFLSCLS